MKKQIKTVTVLGLALSLLTACYTADLKNKKVGSLQTGINDISFKSQTIHLAGHLHLPDGFDASKKYPAVIFTGPLMQVKEQMGDVYGKRMAGRGYVYLSFDSYGFGESEGQPRNMEQPFNEMEGIRDGISYLGSLPFVDKDKLFGIGGCAGGGYMAIVAVTDKRLKAIVSISGMMDNKGFVFGLMDRKKAVQTFKEANKARQRQFETGKVETMDVLSFEGKDCSKLPSVMREGCEYYFTDRGVTKNYTHRGPTNFNEYQALTSAADYAPYLYTPYLGIYGSEATYTGPLTVKFYDKASQPKELYEVKGSSHVGLYDVDKHVSKATVRADEFFKKYSK